jgi:hypothetical protein
MKTKKYPTHLYIIFSLCFLILPILAGCGTVEAGAAQPEPENHEGAKTESGGLDPGGIGTIEIGVEPTPLPERASYTNHAYGFAFDYPETWTLTEQDHGVVLQKGTNRLGINFRWADEQIDQWGRTGMGAGDLIYAGKINFMNQVIPAEALRYEKETKAVFYGESGMVEDGDLVFIIALEDLETDYTDVDLSEEIISRAGTILESFRHLDTTISTQTSYNPSGLEAYLMVQGSIQQGSRAPIIVDFLLENHTQQGLYLLKWYTPLEGIAGDIFEVTRDGQPIPYLGPMVSRAAPTPESYVFVEPDKGMTGEVNVAEVYDFSQLGTYIIKFRSPRIAHIARSEAEMATTLDELGPVNISSNQVTLEVVASSTGMGQSLRRTAEEAGEIISTHLLEKKPGLMEGPALAFEEVPDEMVWKELQGQVFRVTEGFFKNESFLLLPDRVIQLGEAIGGQGLTSLVVADLDQDGQSELFFSYTAGLGPGIGSGIQTRVGMVEPGADVLRVIEADMAYLGTAAIRLEASNDISLNIVETDDANQLLRYLDRLGNLSIESKKSGESLIVNFNPDLPPEIRENILTRQ